MLCNRSKVKEKLDKDIFAFCIVSKNQLSKEILPIEHNTRHDSTSVSPTYPMSYISDANVLALHKLLWYHQEKIGDYLSSGRDHKAIGRRLFDKIVTLLAYLGPPDYIDH
jgi:hypothetical protein